MIQNAPLLILDEATSSVDTRMERMVQAAMDQFTVGRTSFDIKRKITDELVKDRGILSFQLCL